MPRLDLTAVEIRPFTNSAITNRFSCGKRPLDQFIRNKAKKAMARIEYRVSCAHLEDSANVVGYYALQIGSDAVAELPAEASRTYLGNYSSFPAVHLGFLGVSDPFQRQGLGQHLLMDVFSKTAAISDNAGLFALTLVSYDRASTAFYESIGFEIYSKDLAQPKMLYPIETLLAVVGRQPPWP